MAKKGDADLFQRLREAGLRKQVAKTLSELGDDAGKKVQRAGQAAAAELRSLAEEIERRLPKDEPAKPAARRAPARRATGATRRTTGTARTAAKPAAAKPAPKRSTAAKPAGAKPAAKRTTTPRTGTAKSTTTPRATRSSPARRTGGGS